MKFTPYPRYKDSGIEWLGEIPEHWLVQKLKYNSYAKGRIGWQNLRSDEFTAQGAYLITGMHFSKGRVDWDSCFHVDEERYKVAPEIQVKEKDVLITKDGTIGKIAFIDYLPYKATLNSHLLLLRPLRNKYSPKFLFHFLGSEIFQTYVKEKQTGTTFFGITQESIVNCPFLLPPLAEQKAIAGFLDAETLKIDELIGKQERLIVLLQEKRQALIFHAVTKGLNPNAPRKDSGIAWLGKIPEHWEVKRLRFLCSITTGNKNTEDSIEDGEYPFFVRSQEVERINSYSFDGEAILTAGDGAGVGKVFHYYKGKLDFHQRVYLLSNFKAIVGNLLFHFLKVNFYKIVLEGNAKSTVDSLRLPMFQDFPVAYSPSINEQKEIVEYINRETAKIDALMEKARRAIGLLQEHRTALISSAVTGKIDVRRNSDGNLSNH